MPRSDVAADLRRMQALLRQEESALRRCDWTRLERCARRKEAVLARLEQSPAVQDTGTAALAGQMRAAALRNARVFEAVLAGLRDARALIERARNPQPASTYARNGSRKTLGAPNATMERRA
ncbi:MAG: hypothetical protein KDJ98_17805 [Rhodobacteraceae bacterium]|nr:hypothetical protein [Paracoccaceae bacterium]